MRKWRQPTKKLTRGCRGVDLQPGRNNCYLQLDRARRCWKLLCLLPANSAKLDQIAINFNYLLWTLAGSFAQTGSYKQIGFSIGKGLTDSFVTLLGIPTSNRFLLIIRQRKVSTINYSHFYLWIGTYLFHPNNILFSGCECGVYLAIVLLCVTKKGAVSLLIQQEV